MADSFLAYQNPTVTDKKLDSETLTVGANTVERERVMLAGTGATDFILPVAHDAPDAGSPLKIGGKASSTTPADVSLTGDRVDAYFDMKGRQAIFTDVALPAGTNNIGDVDVLSLPALPAGANNIGDVDIASLPNEGQQTMANSISVAVASDQSAIPVGGNVAHNAADSGNPSKIGYKAIAHGTNPTAVAAASRTDGYANRAGIPFVIGGHPNIVTIELAWTAAQTDIAIVTVAAGLKIVVTRVTITMDEANTVGVGVRIGLGTVNTPTTTGVVASHPGMVPGSIMTVGDGSGILGVGADDADLRITAEVPTGGSGRAVVSYYTIES